VGFSTSSWNAARFGLTLEVASCLVPTRTMFFKRLFRRAAPPAGAVASPQGGLDASSPIVIELASMAVAHLGELAPDWTTAYVRIACDAGSRQSKGSYVTASGIFMFNAMADDFLRRMREVGGQLFEAMKKDRGVALLIVRPDLDYEIRFEWEDLERWPIAKLNGATGIPVGL